MNLLRRFTIVFALIGLMLSPGVRAEPIPPPSSAKATPAPPASRPGPETMVPAGGQAWYSLFNGHLTLGTRLTWFTFVEEPSTNYLGTIGKLDEVQDYIPWKFYALWQFTPHWGMDLTWDQVEGKTITRTTDEHTDGNFKASGPICDVVYQMNTYGRFTPYAQAGLAWMHGTFDPATWWALGYTHEQDWLDMGSPGKARQGKRRNIDLDDSLGFVAGAGTRIAITKRWSGDLLLRYMHLENDANFSEKISKRVIRDEDASIPLHNLALGVGVAYVF